MKLITSMRVCLHIHSTFYVVTKFILPSIGDLNFSKLNYDNTWTYLDKSAQTTETLKHVRSNDLLQNDRTICIVLQKIDKII